MKYLVAGAGGFIGGHITNELLKQGHDVTCVDIKHFNNWFQINKNSKIRIAIIDKDLKNIPGGIAYSLEKSKYGFFNNPLRLSHPEFKKWINKPKNFKKCPCSAKI